MNPQPQDNLTITLAELDACVLTFSYEIIRRLKKLDGPAANIIAANKLSALFDVIDTLNKQAGRQTIINNKTANTLTDVDITAAFTVIQKLFERLSARDNSISTAE